MSKIRPTNKESLYNRWLNRIESIKRMNNMMIQQLMTAPKKIEFKKVPVPEPQAWMFYGDISKNNLINRRKKDNSTVVN